MNTTPQGSNPTNHGDSELRELRALRSKIDTKIARNSQLTPTHRKILVEQIMATFDQALKAHTEALIARLPDKRQRIDDAVDGDEEYGTFCANCGLSTDTDVNTGKCYCDHYNEAIDDMKAALKDTDKEVR